MLKENEINVGDTHSAVLVDDLKRTQIVQYAGASGDYNPLHSDPSFAKAAGFEKPILHGMCTYGIACRSIIESICEKDVKRLKRFDCRFSSPVYPGETIITEMWKNGNVIHFQSKVKERDKIVIKNGESEVV